MSAEPEKLVATFDLPGATVQLGFLDRAPLFLVCYDSGRAAVVYSVGHVVIELASTR